MWEWGQPLHAFDYEKIKGRQISVRRARAGEELVTLDGVLRRLSKEDLLITDEKEPIAIAGVMGGLDSEVSDKTRSILLESANFELTTVRRTVQALKLPSEASLRFGKGIDPELTIPTLQRASLLVKKISGASIPPEIADAYPVRAQEKTIHLGTQDVRRILGMDFSLKEISDILTSLKFRCKKTGKAGKLRVIVPTHRLDVSIPADLIEEVARIYGYERIPATLMGDTLPPQRENHYLAFEEQIRDVLVGCGLTEIITYTMTNMESLSKLDPERRDLDPSGFITLVNPTSPDKMHMRQSLLPGILDTLCFNSRISEQLMFYEIGRVYYPVANQELPAERHRLAIAMSGSTERTWWRNPETPTAGFFHLKGILETLFHSVGVPSRSFLPARHRTFHPGKSAVVQTDGIEVGFLGELHPDVCRSFELPDQPVVVADLNLDALFEHRGACRYRPISPFPPAKEDLAVVLEEKIPAGDVMGLVVEAGRPLVTEARVFDVWKGKNIPTGKKSIAFSLTYQAADRVLMAEEIEETREKIIKRLSDALGARLRE